MSKPRPKKIFALTGPWTYASHAIPHVPWVGTSRSLVHGHAMGSNVYHETLEKAPRDHWSMLDIPWDPTCTMGHWDRHLAITGPCWTSHGIPHVPWDTGTGTLRSLVHGHPMGSHMYHGTLGQALHWSMDITWDPTCTMGQDRQQ